MKLKTPQEVRLLVETMLELEQAMPNIIRKQRIWDRPVSVQEKVWFIRNLAETRVKMLQKAEEIYPEIAKKNVSIGIYWITYED